MELPTLEAFTADERDKLHILLAAKVAQMMGRTFEEADWTEVYCAAKGIPLQVWSNLHLDINHGGLGVEQKRLAVRGKKTVLDRCGTTLMHPAETRSIRIPSTSVDANDAMRDVFAQYAENITQQRALVQAHAPGVQPDMRRGWLLYQADTLSEFLYFEEPRVAPDPADYYAQWKTNPAKGARKGSINLWIYHKGTRKKRYSVTTEAGVKLQPYFDVPPPDDPHLYTFVVQGEEVGNGEVRIWITLATARELERLLGSLATDVISRAILDAVPDRSMVMSVTGADSVRPVMMHPGAYEKLKAEFEGVSDEHRMQLFLQYLRSS
jgi:hypothetical protein